LGLSPGFIHGACLSEGQRTDMKVFPKLWAEGNWEGIVYVIADPGYDFYDVRKPLKDTGRQPVIPRRKGAICPGVRDKQRYQTRSNIERFFGKIKENKRLALRYDKLDVTFFSFFALACLKVLKLFC
jgi:transposase